MSAFQIFTQPSQQALDTAANVLSGATLTFSLTGTSTPTNAYADSGLVTPLANPLSANSAGVWVPIFLNPSVLYRIVLKTSGGAVLQTWDPANEDVAGLISGSLTQAIIGALLYPRTQAEIDASVTPTNYAYPPYNVLRYGADPTGVSPADTPFNNAISAATQEGNAGVVVPQGKYLINGTITLHQGVPIIGQSMGSTLDYGCSILHAGTGDCFKWDGNGITNKGTGGGLRDMLIVKQTGVSGGYAINLVATDDNHRPTEFWFQNILIYATGTGQWARAFNIDGTACNTPGGKGVRDIAIFKLRVAGCSDNNKYINISQGVHVHGSYIEIDTGNGTGTTGMTIDGDGGPVCLSSIEINGNVIINDTSSNVNLQGHISTLDVNAVACNGSFIGSAATITNVCTDFRIVSPLVGAFSARLTSTTSSDKTGDGTAYTVIPDTEKFDRDSSFDNTTGIHTPKQAGLWSYYARATINNAGAGHTRYDIAIVRQNSGGTEQERANSVVNPANSLITSGRYTQEVVGEFFLNEGDKVFVSVTVSGSTKTVGLLASDQLTYFAGKLLA